jgi:hypothetical protein
MYPDGPMLPRGEVTIVLSSGDQLERRRRVIDVPMWGRADVGSAP